MAPNVGVLFAAWLTEFILESRNNKDESLSKIYFFPLIHVRTQFLSFLETSGRPVKNFEKRLKNIFLRNHRFKKVPGSNPVIIKFKIPHSIWLANQVLDKTQKDLLFQDKLGLEISVSADDQTCFIIQNNSRKTRVLDQIRFVSHTPKYFTHSRTLPFAIPPHFQCHVQIESATRTIGSFSAIVIFEFSGQPIAKTYEFSQIDDDVRSLKPIALFIKPKVKYQDKDIRSTIKGVRPPRPKIKLKNRLISVDIPAKFSSLPHQDLPEILQTPLSPENYFERFQTQLWLEELQMNHDIQTYDQNAAQMEVSGRFLLLKVEGLAESRPSVVFGDKILVRHIDGSLYYEGYVHQVHREEVLLQFHRKFHADFKPSMRFHVRFTLKRTPLLLAHNALLRYKEFENHLKGRVFPKKVTTFFKPSVTNIQPIVRGQKYNASQLTAITNIVNFNFQEGSYVIFGPPGTGKTTTLLESILQIHQRFPNRKLLVCAPSNSAADHICDRLGSHGIDSKTMLRVNGYQRPRKDMPPSVLSFSLWDEETGVFPLPSLTQVKEMSIIVATCSMTGKLHMLGIPPTHFTDVFIDESGQIPEPEGIIPLTVAPFAERVVLAGDPRQLGPIIRSSRCLQSGFQISLLERLMDEKNEFYYLSDPCTNQYIRNPSFITMLDCNYRSNPDIIKIPSELFYENKLKSCVDIETSQACFNFPALPNPKCPVLFHGVSGKEEREANSPSWFNSIEAVHVLKMIDSLVNWRSGKIAQNQIGVIAPYHRQVQKIRQILQGKGFPGVMVGSVEKFQGRERKVIIVSCVRSQAKFLDLDKKYSIGFLGNEKRFNVALTRAKCLLIVIGNPNTLAIDPHWRKFIDFCSSKGSCSGVKLAPDVDESLANEFEAMTLQEHHEEEKLIKSSQASVHGFSFDKYNDY